MPASWLVAFALEHLLLYDHTVFVVREGNLYFWGSLQPLLHVTASKEIQPFCMHSLLRCKPKSCARKQDMHAAHSAFVASHVAAE